MPKEGTDNIEIDSTLNQATRECMATGVQDNIGTQIQITGSLIEPHGKPAIEDAFKRRE